MPEIRGSHGVIGHTVSMQFNLTGKGGAVDGEIAEVADEGERDGFRAEELLSEGLDVGGDDRLDLGDDLVDGEEAAEVHLLAGEIGHAAGGGFEAKHDVALELVLGALQFRVGDGSFP